MPQTLRNGYIMCPLPLASFLLLRAQLCCCVSLKVLWGRKVSHWHMSKEPGFALINTIIAVENRIGINGLKREIILGSVDKCQGN